MAKRKFRDIATISGLIFKGYPGNFVSNKHIQSSSSLIYEVFNQYDPDNLLIKQAKEEVNKAKDYSALVKLFDSLYEKYFLNYNVKIKDFKEKIIKEKNFKKLPLNEQKKMFLNMLDLNLILIILK